ncbi:MAG: Lactoylglutathione lyase, partial [uncultured Solirubrobacteraceae bacterium]
AAHPHLLPDRRHRPVGRLLRDAGLRGAPPPAHPRRGDQRLHGPARRRRPPRADLQLRRRLLRPRHGLQPHRPDRRRPRRHAGATRGQGDRPGEAAVSRTRGRLPPVLRARSGRLPDRAHRTLTV